MKKRIYCIICLCSLVSIMLYACGKQENLTPETVTFQATVMTATDATDSLILVQPIDGSFEFSCSDEFIIPNEEHLELQIGDLIEITYSGAILESYPAQLEKVYNITVVQEN